MTPPRLRLTHEEPLELVCSTCEVASVPFETTASEISEAVAVPPTPLEMPDWLQSHPFRTPLFFRTHWGLLAEMPPMDSLRPEVAIHLPLGDLSQAYLDGERLRFADFLPALVTLLNQAEAIDLDFFNIPVNRGATWCRFSEYSPREERSRPCNIRTQGPTTARAHGEVRPIAGSSESMITRISVDFQPNLFNEVPNLPALEIDGFAAVDPPLMDFDRSFADRAHIVLGMHGGDYSYENPMDGPNGHLAVTPFGAIAPVPPGGHNYWMFRFSPIVDTAIAGLQVAVSNGDLPITQRGLGALLLWAFLPTQGLGDPEIYDSLHVPFNTFPRRLGDVLQIFEPLIRGEGPRLRQDSPLYNPNSEYIDLEGIRRRIPDDPEALARINAEREAYNRAHPGETPLPVIERNRGPVLDWIFTDLAADPARLAALLLEPRDTWPTITSHIRFRETALELPFGTLSLGAGTEVQLQYGVEPVAGTSGAAASSRLFLRAELEPVDIRGVNLEVGPYHITADSIHADEVTMEARDLGGLIAMLGGTGTLNREHAFSVILYGVRITNGRFTDRRSGMGVNLADAELGGLRLSWDSSGWRVELGEAMRRADRGRDTPAEPPPGLTAEGLDLRTPYGNLGIDVAEIPALTLRHSRHARSADPRTTLSIPRVESRGSLRLSRVPSLPNLPLAMEMEGNSVLSNFSYYYRPNAELAHQARADFTGEVGVARILHPEWGTMEFSTRAGEEASPPMHGRLQMSVRSPLSEEEGPRVSGLLDLHLPFVSLGADGPYLSIPRESSTLRDGRVLLEGSRLLFEGLLDVNGARLGGLGEGPTELGAFVISAQDMDLHDIRARGGIHFESDSDGYRVSTPEGLDPLSIEFLVENLGIAHRPGSAAIPGEIPAAIRDRVLLTEMRLDHAEVAIDGLSEIEYRRTVVDGARRGRLARLEFDGLSAHHLRGGGDVWAPLPIWGLVRGHFPALGGSGGGSARRPRPDSGLLLAEVPEALRCEIGDGDFIRLGTTEFRIYPFPAALVEDRRRHSASGATPLGDWGLHMEDIVVNFHESAPEDGGRSRGQFAMVRIPEFNAGRRWVEYPPGEGAVCEATRAEEPGAMCGDERASWNLGTGEIFANVYLNDPHRGGSFLFNRWPAPGTYESLGTYLNMCVAP